MSVRWVPDPNEPTGGYFIDAQGRRLPPGPVYNPQTGVWERTNPETGEVENLGRPQGSAEPVPAEVPAPTAAAAPAADPVAPILADWIARHGPQTGTAFEIDPEIDVYDEANQRTIKGPNPNPVKRYHFQDGSILEITSRGEVRGAKEEAGPKAQPQEGQERESVREGKNVKERFEGGQWIVKQILGEAAGAGGAQEGARRTSIRDGKNVEEAYEGGQWVVKRIIGTAEGTGQPQEGQRRTSVREGKNVEEAYEGGQWVVKRIVGAAEGTGQPTEGQRRTRVAEGRNVEEAYEGGQWVIKRIVGPAEGTGQPIEGQTRARVLEGRNVEEAYEGGQWVVKKVGGRAIPEAPTAVSGSADSPYILSRNPETGALQQEPNPNYQPKTAGDVSARIGQIQTLANAKKQEVMSKYASDPEKGLAEFNRWWDENVQGQMTALQSAAEQANFARAKEMATMRQQALQQAQVAGTQAVQAEQASMPYRVGPRAAEVANQVAREGLKNVDWTNAAFYQAPSVRDLAAQATEKAYQGLMGNQPQYTPLSPTAELDRTRYTPSFAPPGAQPAAATPAPGTAPNLFHATPIMTTPGGQTQWQYPFGNAQGLPPPPTPEMAEPMQEDFDYNALMQSQLQSVPYTPPAATFVRRQPAPIPVNQAPFYQQALAAGLGSGGLGPTAPDPFYQQALAAGLGAGGLGPAAAAPVPEPVAAYTPPPYTPQPEQWPVIEAAQAVYQAMPQTQIGPGPGQWRNPNAIPPPAYVPQPYEWPGMDDIIGAAQGLYQRFPRTNWR